MRKKEKDYSYLKDMKAKAYAKAESGQIAKALEKSDNPHRDDTPVKTLTSSFVVRGEPIPLSRPRMGRQGFYNPDAKAETDFRNQCKHQVTEEWFGEMKRIFDDEANPVAPKRIEHEYYITMKIDFYVAIPKSDTLIDAYLKDIGKIKPTARIGDVDNYIKFVLDAMHEVIYSDDKHVTRIVAEKHYSFEPRTEIQVTAEIYD